MTEATNGSAPIDSKRAAVIYTAIELAIANVKDVLERNTKQSAPYRSAMTLQLAEYEAEKARLAAQFPVLANAA
jgi:hypothetical protein